MTISTIADIANIVDDVVPNDRFVVSFKDPTMSWLPPAEIETINEDERRVFDAHPVIEDRKLTLLAHRFDLTQRSLRVWFYETSAGTVRRSLIACPRRMRVTVDMFNVVGEGGRYFAGHVEPGRVAALRGNAGHCKPLVVGMTFPIVKGF